MTFWERFALIFTNAKYLDSMLTGLRMTLAISVGAAALGLWLLAIPQSVVALIQYICGAVILFHGVIDLQSAIALMKMRIRRSWVELLLALATVGLAVVIFLNPFGTVEALVMLMGWVLVFDGGSDLWIVFRLSRAVRQAQKNIIESESRELD